MVEAGKLIVLEAADDGMLDHMVDGLVYWLNARGLAAERTREPTYGPAGTLIMLTRQGRLELDAKSMALLYLADRLDHVERADGVARWLAEGRHVVCAHYDLAAAAWLWGRVDPGWLFQIDALAYQPDLTLFVDAPAPGREQMDLRDNYAASIAYAQSVGRKVVTVRETLERSLQAACQGHVAQLLGLAMAGAQQRVLE